ncbi:MAG TPA: amino acid adenylation domain-containing protein [Ktedonosporobacter sp.]|nr:amino acid adenylation domain-containing protein [Ktedonosporobacter sp.]
MQIESHRDVRTEDSTEYSSFVKEFEDWASRTPTASALIAEEKTLAYRDLNERANQLAHYLQTHGIGPEICVGVSLYRSPLLLISFLAILKAGGIYFPIDPAYPQKRQRFLLQDARPVLLLTESVLFEQFSSPGTKMLALDTEAAIWQNYPKENLDIFSAPGQGSYFIYTSGSTGQPKGVLLTHQGLINVLKDQREFIGTQPGDRVAQFASIGFDASVWEFVMALGAGATLCLPPRVKLLPTPEFLAWLQVQQITIVTLPPSFLSLLPPADLPALHCIISAGEACPADLVEHWGTKRRFMNAYGPTEATICATMGRCSPDGAKPTIGKPLPNAEICILDEKLQPVHPGAIGDLYIGGTMLARGYWYRPDLTAERFIPHPFSSLPGARLYQTGDLARSLSNGEIDFLGRRDDQIKLRGFRIEPGEIESVLRRHELVRDTLVICRENNQGIPLLIAYVVLEHQTLTQDTLRTYLAEHLPTYMLPDMFIALQYLPLNAHGKIDRHALPAPSHWRRELSTPFVHAQTAVEIELQSIWEEVLHQQPVGIDDSFFDLGGNSLLITQILARICARYAVELPVGYFFSHPTVRAQAEYIQEYTSEATAFSPIVPLQRDSFSLLPLSFSQERVWFLLQLDPTNMAYHAQATIRLQGQLNIVALERSLNEIVRRHEIFRTTFPAIDGRPMQQIHEFEPFVLPVLDFTHYPIEEFQMRTSSWLRTEFARPFDFTQLPLVRWHLLSLAPQDHLLVHVEHHLIHDGWSFTVFLRELEALYGAFTTGQASQLPPLTLQFADFAHWQHQWMQGSEASRQLAYWKERLANIPPALELPTDYPRPVRQSFRGNVVRAILPLPLQYLALDFCQHEKQTFFMVLFSAFLMLIYRYTGQTDLCVGTGVANRRHSEIEQLIGMLINTVALRANLADAFSFRELTKQVQGIAIEAYANQDLPFGKVVEAIQPERTLTHSPLYQIAFSFHDSPLSPPRLPGLNIDIQEGLSNESAKMDLSVIAIPRVEQQIARTIKNDAETIFLWEYNTDLFERATIDRMIKHYESLLEQALLHPEAPLASLSLLSREERQRQLYDWNATQASFPDEICVHTLVEQQTQRTPEQVALAFGQQRLTYRELNERANRLAHYLRRLGVGQEVFVGLCMERSFELFIALLAILKAGGVYIPLDPNYPLERFTYLLADSSPLLVLIQEHLRARLPVGQASLLSIEQLRPMLVKETVANPIGQVTAENLAYVIYTSGSTGQPRGVLIEHRGICNMILASIERFTITPTDRILQLASMSFDASVFETFMALCSGATLSIAPSHAVGSGEDLSAYLLQEEITVVAATPSTLDSLQSGDYPSWRCVIVGGDKCSLPTMRRWSQGRDFYNAYAPTEATVYAVMHRKTSHEESALPVGLPIQNMQAYVLDEQQNPVPIGVVGEIYLGGVGLARGYFRQPEITSERFVPHPFSREPGARLYRTGDLARYRENGTLEFVRRVDNQVKLRGIRIELGEIETILSQMDGIREILALVREDKPGNQQLCAYVVSEQANQLTSSEVRAHAQTKLPIYMVPSAYIFLSAFPLDVHGKVDRKRLPPPGQYEPDVVPYEAPCNETERILCEIWSQVLDLDQVGTRQNFFAIGGHSLLATQVVSRIRSSLEVNLTLRALFEHPTVAELALAIVQQQAQLVNEALLAELLEEFGEDGDLGATD